MLGEVNATLITLVPKIQHLTKVSEYRPIACCNVVYKCISKIISSRIQGCLDKLISINQSAFVPGRLIQDNLLITQELLKGYNRKKGPQRCALKIDIAKAYDTVNCRFLENILGQFGFHEKLIGWVMTCVSSAAFSICVNGERFGYFKSGRGLRQGDPMSPYLFTLVTEVLTLMVQRKVANSNHFKYHWGCKEIQLTQLCFAGDLLMLCNGDYKFVEVLKEGLMEFSKTSGLIPNMNKSTIFFGSVKDCERRKILEVIPFTVGKLPMKYLGVLLITKNIRISELFLIPKTTVKDIEKTLKGFLWYQGDLKRGVARMAWKLKGKSIWEIESDENDNGTWKAILNLRSKIRDSVWKKIGDGQITNIWFDKWCKDGPLCDIIPFKSRYEVRLAENASIVDMIVNKDWIWPKQWKMQFTCLSNIKIPDLEEELTDCVLWEDNNGVDGRFSIRKVWKKFTEDKEDVKWFVKNGALRWTSLTNGYCCAEKECMD
ncbi:RNA-directed DNA polymerase, eukaryota, reverse transcriptase zinc-binding domain protein [Tanacetum coccineum]